MKLNQDDPGVMSLGLFALVAFLLVGTIAAFLGRDAGVDPNPMPFSTPDSAQEQMGDAGPASAGPTQTGTLPAQVTESSGIAHSRRNPDIWFTHNDGPDGRVFGVRTDGTLVGTWELSGVQPVDIEDIAAAPCPLDDGSTCLYLADTGDNDRDRDEYAVYVVREPDLMADGTGGALQLVAAQRYTYSGDSRDAEALAVLPNGEMLVITKGQEEGAELFRLPSLRRTLPGAPSSVQPAESLGLLPIDVDRKRDRVTGAAISPSGRRLAVRSDVGVRLFEMPSRTLITECPFENAGQQGEAVDFLDETTIVMTFEAAGGQAPIVRATCGT